MRKVVGVWMNAGLLTLAVACGGGASDSSGEGQVDARSDAPAAAAQMLKAIAHIQPTSGNELTGTATFSGGTGEVALVLKVHNGPPGSHAFHLHETGDCSAPDGTSAGGHWNPTRVDHGRWAEEPFHLGDVGNLEIGETGSGSLSLITDLWSIGTGEENDVVGRAVIVHEGADDFTSQPTGAAGGRIGCGVIELQ